MTAVPAILPFYFGKPDGPLFGCYHEPAAARRKNCAVLICQPAGHEYVNCHRALRQLAGRLSDAGFPVLRFDYYGCGDSSGDAGEGTLHRWLEDVATAATELRRRTGLARICVVGLRLGGALAMIAGAERGDFESLVLWDPVVRGESYLRELLQLQKEMSRFRPRAKAGGKSADAIEILGFPVPPALRHELERLDLLAVPERPAKNVLIVESSEFPEDAALKDHFSRSRADVEYQNLKAPQIWLPAENGSLLVPFPLLQSVVSWATRTHA